MFPVGIVNFLKTATAQKVKFSLRLSSVNVTKTTFPADLVTVTEEILNRKLHFLCSELFKENLRHGCFWHSYHRTVKSTRVFFVWFRVFTCSRTWLKTYQKRCTDNSLLSTWQNNFFLAWIILLSAFNFRICFGETLAAFDFDEKFTQSVAQITMLYHVSKDFLRLHLALDQFKGIT